VHQACQTCVKTDGSSTVPSKTQCFLMNLYLTGHSVAEGRHTHMEFIKNVQFLQGYLQLSCLLCQNTQFLQGIMHVKNIMFYRCF